MKTSFLVFALLASAAAHAQVSTQCQNIAGTVYCNSTGFPTGPAIQAPPMVTGPSADFGAMLNSFQQGQAAAELARQQAALAAAQRQLIEQQQAALAAQQQQAEAARAEAARAEAARQQEQRRHEEYIACMNRFPKVWADVNLLCSRNPSATPETATAQKP